MKPTRPPRHATASPATADSAESGPVATDAGAGSGLIAAATVVLLRPARGGAQILLTRRPKTMAFGPDIHVFPGGRLDAADRDRDAVADGLSADEAAVRLGLGLAPDGGMTPRDALAYHVAAARETHEETGIRVDAADLIALTRWVTPISMPRRFDVRFFAAAVPAGTEVVADSDEVVETVWLRPEEALRASIAGTVALWQPTFVTLEQLTGTRGSDDVRRTFTPGPDAGGPTFDPIGSGIVRVGTPWAAGIPGRRSTTLLLGTSDVIVVDPGDPTDVTFEAIRSEVSRAGGRLVGIVVTDLTPERHAGVEMFAHGLDLPVAGPPDAAARAPYLIAGIGETDRVPFGGGPLTLTEIRRIASDAALSAR